MKKNISIPRRYAKNTKGCRTNRQNDEFQFLVGTLKTYTNDEIKAWYIAIFQFLVGTLKTENNQEA